MSGQFPYMIWPFNFKKFDEDSFLLVNEAGDHLFLSSAQFKSFVSYELPKSENLYQTLESSQFVSGEDIGLSVNLAATKYRTRKRFLTNFTALHMMVVTVRCNHRCRYCQVSSEAEETSKFDMSPETARRVTDCIFQAPGRDIKIEFQGGEPLCNWETVTATIEHAEELNKTCGKNLEFVLCTNLTLINEEQLKFLRDHRVSISTSLDGDREIHDKNRRLRTGGSSYDLFMKKLDLARSICGDAISALMTTTRDNLPILNKVVDEYFEKGFPGIFLRPLNPYGFASQNAHDLGYPIEEFVKAYRKTIDYIIQLNLKGRTFVEYYAKILLTRILTPFSTGFVDLQSPAGTGISGVIYDYNGEVYPADEARMLARMGDTHFKMGNVFDDSYLDMFRGRIITEIVENSCVETLPGCISCAYRAYCGADPVRNYLECKDIVGHRPTSGFCKKYLGLFDFLFQKLQRGNEDELDVLWSWITQHNLMEVRGEDD